MAEAGEIRASPVGEFGSNDSRSRPPHMPPHSRIIAWFELMHLPSSLVFSLAVAAAMAGAQVAPSVLLISVLQILAGASSGFILNEMRDLPSDRIDKPHRPLVSGRISSNCAAAGFWITHLAAWALAITLALTTSAGWILLAYGVGGTSYCLIKSRLGLFKNYYFAACTCLPFVYALLVSGKTADKWVLVASLFLYLAFRELLMDIHDVAGDCAAGLQTVAARLGPQRSSDVAAIFWSGSMIAAATAGMHDWQRPLAVIGIVASAIHLLQWSPTLTGLRWRRSTMYMWLPMLVLLVLFV